MKQFLKERFCTHIYKSVGMAYNGTTAVDDDLFDEYIVSKVCVKCGKNHYAKEHTFLGDTPANLLTLTKENHE